jgi:hypothetical protein
MFQILQNRVVRLERSILPRKRLLAQKKQDYALRHFEIVSDLSSKIDDIENPRMRATVRRVFLHFFPG